MFDKSIDQRFSVWYKFRQELNQEENPLASIWNFWKSAPFIPYNHKIDHYDKSKWPTPWEIIIENKYDDFTKAVMIGWTLKFCDKFKNSQIQIWPALDNVKNTYYNIVCIDNEWILNFSDDGPMNIDSLPKTISIEYVIDLTIPE